MEIFTNAEFHSTFRSMFNFLTNRIFFRNNLFLSQISKSSFHTPILPKVNNLCITNLHLIFRGETGLLPMNFPMYMANVATRFYSLPSLIHEGFESVKFCRDCQHCEPQKKIKQKKKRYHSLFSLCLIVVLRFSYIYTNKSKDITNWQRTRTRLVSLSDKNYWLEVHWDKTEMFDIETYLYKNVAFLKCANLLAILIKLIYHAVGAINTLQ